MPDSILVVGDIHGCYSTFLKLLEQAPPDIRVISVGDIIDRGPQSEQLVDYFRNHELVLGNHELMAIEALPTLKEKPEHLIFTDWFNNGGQRVVDSYSSIDKLISDIEWFTTLPIAFELPVSVNSLPVVVSHTSLSPYIDNTSALPIAFEEPHVNHMVWNRCVPYADAPYFNIYGHTPVDALGVRNKQPIAYTNGLNLDTGCVYHSSPNRGMLSAVLLPSMTIIQTPFIKESS